MKQSAQPRASYVEGRGKTTDPGQDGGHLKTLIPRLGTPGANSGYGPGDISRSRAPGKPRKGTSRGCGIQAAWGPARTSWRSRWSPITKRRPGDPNYRMQETMRVLLSRSGFIPSLLGAGMAHSSQRSHHRRSRSHTYYALPALTLRISSEQD